MTPFIAAFEQSPDEGRGSARDMRVRWALEEAGTSRHEVSFDYRNVTAPR